MAVRVRLDSGRRTVMRIFQSVVFTSIFLFATQSASRGAIDDRQPLPTPVMRTVNPETVKAGEVAIVSGEYLDKSRVAEVYLTDGKVDIKVEIVEQASGALKFRVPEKTAAGRYNMMVLLVDEVPKLIEEPARLTVE
jgi:hypothetical protein